MKRHPALRNLSVDHHHALVQAHRLQQVADTDEAARRAVVDDFLCFWREHADIHFREEEEALLPFFAGFSNVNAEPIRLMQCEHIYIRRSVAALRTADPPEAAALCALGQQLEAHVRLEERVVFPLIEQALPHDALKELPGVLAAWHAARKDESHG